jgi:hypothetical protein
MRCRGVIAVAGAAFALLPASAAALPGHGPREDIDQSFTSTKPGTPTGASWKGTYHAAGNKRGTPPYMLKMIFYPPKGMRYDTNVPAKCTAPDAVLQVMGPNACPPGSLIARGSTQGIFYQPIGHAFEFDRFDHKIYVMNNTNEQIILVEAEGYAVVRGKVRPDGSQVFVNPTCFPEPPTGCVDDYVLQTGSASKLARYTRAVNGAVKSYATTPQACPRSGYWRSVVKFWWKGGAVDSVVTKQPCRPARRP